jgi:hypothetical protein
MACSRAKFTLAVPLAQIPYPTVLIYIYLTVVIKSYNLYIF